MNRKEGILQAISNKAKTLELKKCAVKFTDPYNSFVISTLDKAMNGQPKAYLREDDDEKGILKRTIVANTYLWLDSHEDVHMPGIFSRSIQERGKNAPHLHDHLFQLTAKVGDPIGYSERQLSWAELGVNRGGVTTSLILETEIKRSYNGEIYNQYKEDKIDQHSVGMRYIRIDLAADDQDYDEEYKHYKEVIDLLGNKDKAEAAGYFFIVREAALMETSAVLMGSNELTPTMGNSKVAPVETIPPQPTLADSFTREDAKYILQNFKLS